MKYTATCMYVSLTERLLQWVISVYALHMRRVRSDITINAMLAPCYFDADFQVCNMAKASAKRRLFIELDRTCPRISVRMLLRFAILIRSAPAEKVSLPWTRIEWPVAKRATRGCK